MSRKVIYLDMDDVIADFEGFFSVRNLSYREPIPEMHQKGFFHNLSTTRDAHVHVRELIALSIQHKCELHILTQPVKNSAHSYSDKVTWIATHFPELIGHITMTQDKSLMSAPDRYLIDDNEEKWKDRFEAHGGKFIKFDPVLVRRNPGLAWAEVRGVLLEHIAPTPSPKPIIQ